MDRLTFIRRSGAVLAGLTLAGPLGRVLDAIPPAPEIALPTGTFLYKDAGVLELGIVRDSVLNVTNDFQIFGETWDDWEIVDAEKLRPMALVA